MYQDTRELGALGVNPEGKWPQRCSLSGRCCHSHLPGFMQGTTIPLCPSITRGVPSLSPQSGMAALHEARCWAHQIGGRQATLSSCAGSMHLCGEQSWSLLLSCPLSGTSVSSRQRHICRCCTPCHCSALCSSGYRGGWAARAECLMWWLVFAGLLNIFALLGVSLLSTV